MTGVREALDRARNSNDGPIDSQTSAILEAAIQELWNKIQAQSNSYVLTPDEFALFNYFRKRFGNSAVARKAVERYWNSFHGDAASAQGNCTA